MGLKYSGSGEVTEIGEMTTAVAAEPPEEVFETFRFAST